MKEILQKFSPEISSALVGEEIPENSGVFLYPLKIEKVFDLHGYYESEISGKIKFIWEFCHHHHYSRIKIVTGKGKKILFSEVLRILKREEKKNIIHHFSSDEGSFEIFLKL